MEKLKIINSYITKGSFQDCLENVFSLAERKRSSYVCFANVHMVVEAYKDESFNKILKEADMVTPDGAPVSKVMSLFYKYKQDRVAGMDLLPRLLEESARRKKSVYFYGSTEHVLQTIRSKANKELPDLKIAGMYSPPFRKLSEEEDAAIIKEINDSGASLVFVALGCPKQEKWMAEHKNKISACMLGVGQAFLVYAGLEKRLPLWARRLCLEWVYRLYLEPGRLWKRYLVSNSLFIILIAKLLISGNKNREVVNQFS